MSSGGREDFTGKVMDPEKTGNGDITLYVERFEDDGKKRSHVDHDKRQSLKKETKVRVQGRFYKALDLITIITATGTNISWKKNDSL